MILFICEDCKCSVSFLKESYETISLFGYEVGVQLVNDSYYLQLPSQLVFKKNEAIRHRAELIIENVQTRKQVQIFASSYEKGFDVFKHYRTDKECISIGNSIDDDIYIQDEYFSSEQYVIHTDFRMIECLSESSHATLDGSYIESKKSYSNGSVFLSMNLCIVFHQDFLMINSCENIYISLSVYMPDFQKISNHKMIFEPKQRQFRNGNLMPECKVFLPEPIEARRTHHDSIVFSMGPALTMSAASLFSGMLAVYNGILNGRQVSELIPLITLPGVMMISSLLWNPLHHHYELRKESKSMLERNYLYRKELSKITEMLHEDQCHYRKLMNKLLPPPNQLFGVNDLSEILHQKTDRTEDFGLLRIGYGNSNFPLTIERSFHKKGNEEIWRMSEELQNCFSTIENVPIYIDLKKLPKVFIEDENLFLSLIFQSIVYFGKDTCRIVVLASEEWLYRHNFLLKMENTESLQNSQLKLIATHKEDLSFIKDDLKKKQFTLILVQNPNLYELLKYDDAAVLMLGNRNQIPDWITVKLLKDGNDGRMEELTEEAKPFHLDIFQLECLKQFGNTIGLKSENQRNQIIRSANSFFDMYGVDSAVNLHIQKRWTSSLTRNEFRIPIGVDMYGNMLELDLNEKSQGPHGLIAGATGSGKTVLLVTMILSIAIRFSPREVQLAIIDFKGGGLVHFFQNEHRNLPHLSAVLTNLSDTDMDRAFVSFRNECNRRQKLFAEMGSRTGETIVSLAAYQEVYRKEYGLPYLSSLVIIVDEFAELKKMYPQFMTELISISRIGRSLGVHLILATQKPSGIVDEQIWSNAHFKICLKVQDRADSFEMIRNDSASKIREAGGFYLYCDDELTKGITAYSESYDTASDIRVVQYSYTGNVKNICKKNKQCHVTQIEQTLEEIERVSKIIAERADHLWMNSPGNLDIHFLEENRMGYGILDDYPNGKHEILRYGKNENDCVLAAGGDRLQRIAFLNCMLACVFLQCEDNDEVYLFDAIQYLNQNLLYQKNFVDLIHPEDDMVFHELQKHILKCEFKGDVYFIIDEFSAFFKELTNFEDFFVKLMSLKNAGERIHIIVILRSSNDMPYRYLNYFNVRMQIGFLEKTEASSYFEQSCNFAAPENEFGIIRMGRLLPFRYPKISSEEFSEIARSDGEKSYTLKRIPKVIHIHNDAGFYCVGYDLETIAPVELNVKKGMIVLAIEKKQLDSLYEVWSKSYENCIYGMKNSEVTGAVRFLKLQDYRHETWKENDLLLLGGGWQQQYQMFIPNRLHKKDAQAYLCSDGEWRVIELATCV